MVRAVSATVAPSRGEPLRDRLAEAPAGAGHQGHLAVAHTRGPPVVSVRGIPASLSANFASAASRSRSRCSDGNMSGAGLHVLEQQAGQRHLVHLGRPVGQAEHERLDVRYCTNGISWVVPSEPCSCNARADTSCSTFCIIALTAEMSARTAL